MHRFSTIWLLGFRPFFLLGAALAAFYLLAWVGVNQGAVKTFGYLAPSVWHAHELIFGFSAAIVAGFVLTASQNWTGIRGVHGSKLKLLVGVWLVSRVLFLILKSPSLIAMFLDLSFMPLVGFFLYPYLKDVDLKTERVFFLHFFLIFVGNALVHLDALGFWPGMSTRGLLLGLNTLIVIILFMGGRVIPFFTESSLAKAQPKTYEKIEWACHGFAWLFLISQFFFLESVISAVIAFLCAGFNLIRLYGWQVKRVRRVAIIWVLHLAYLWIVIGYFLWGFVSLGVLSYTIAVHAFTVGGLGAMIYGMITRVSLGHTGRKLRPANVIIAGYVFLNVAALIRVFGPLMANQFYLQILEASGLFWVMAFLIFLKVYTPILTQPRIDGRSG